MSQPLGDAVGNALDVREAVEVLQGEARGRLRDLAVWFAARGLEALDDVTVDEARVRAERAIDDGAALERFRAMVAAQGGDPRVVDDPVAVLPRAPVVAPLIVDRSGTLAAVDAQEIGLASAALGAGRMRKGDPIDPAVGLVLRAKVGDELVTGEPIGEVHARTEEDAREVAERVLRCLDVTDGPVAVPELIHEWRGPTA
jgi:pyrimidine-nucleoside phosphorylase